MACLPSACFGCASAFGALAAFDCTIEATVVRDSGAIVFAAEAVLKAVFRHSVPWIRDAINALKGVFKATNVVVVAHYSGLTVAQMQEAAREGAYIEFVYNALIGPNKEFVIADYTRAIRAIGPQHCILSSDLGQAANPVHTDGWVAYLAALRTEGFTRQELDLMAKTNPARVVGLP